MLQGRESERQITGRVPSEEAQSPKPFGLDTVLSMQYYREYSPEELGLDGYRMHRVDDELKMMTGNPNFDSLIDYAALSLGTRVRHAGIEWKVRGKKLVRAEVFLPDSPQLPDRCYVSLLLSQKGAETKISSEGLYRRIVGKISVRLVVQ
jgi:hypothetical protein